MGHEGGKRWDRRSFPPTLLCDIHQLPACAAVNIEIYYTRAFHHLLHVQGCTVLLNKKKKKRAPEKEKENVSFAVWYVCLRDAATYFDSCRS